MPATLHTERGAKARMITDLRRLSQSDHKPTGAKQASLGLIVSTLGPCNLRVVVGPILHTSVKAGAVNYRVVDFVLVTIF